ncbi:hypothetical protein [uncultured Ruegeria sp.]|uniref:hypothetical protein n=1 Tax=uncultured Ruegeria sp. TaxID=259304 RepID=UPI0026319486|nr:hypothetical protein [uncultured Ruegeria sp.]
MGALRFIGFLLIAAVVVTGLDYYQQDKKSEGTLSFSGYLTTINDRFDLYQSELAAEDQERERQQRWRAGGKALLPASNDEWTRRAIVDADFTLDAREGALQDNISEAARPLAKKVAVQKTEQLAAKMDRNSWVYQKGDHTIWLQVLFKNNANSNTLAGNIAVSVDAVQSSKSDYVPFGIIGGVAIFQFAQNNYNVLRVDDRAFWSMITASKTDLNGPPGFEVYKGVIGLGEEIRFQAYSDAPAEKVRAFLTGLDYDSFNALLRRPVPGISNGSVVNPEDEAELAVNMAGVRSEFAKLRGEIARLRLNNVDGLALLANTMSRQYGLPNDTFDLTGNKISSADDMVQIGYRKGLSDLLEGELQKAETDEGFFGSLFGGFQGNKDATGTKESAGLLAGFKSFFQASDSDQAPQIRVTKGGTGSIGECASKGAAKRCTLGGG